MVSIAAAAGVTKPVLYQHFGSKEDLYLEVVRAVGARLITEIDQITDLEGGTRSRIAHACTASPQSSWNPGPPCACSRPPGRSPRR